MGRRPDVRTYAPGRARSVARVTRGKVFLSGVNRGPLLAPNAMMADLALESPPLKELLGLSLRLLVAALLGGLLGYERQRSGKSAGLRTHMLVALGSGTFVMATAAMGGTVGDLARVVQGAAAGIGFIGAGVILKVSEAERVHGLTTAASI